MASARSVVKGIESGCSGVDADGDNLQQIAYYVAMTREMNC